MAQRLSDGIGRVLFLSFLPSQSILDEERSSFLRQEMARSGRMSLSQTSKTTHSGVFVVVHTVVFSLSLVPVAVCPFCPPSID